MSIYDNNWKSYAMYTVCTVESGADYGAVENWAMAGIGIAQWTFDRSWVLLNMMVTDYPETQSMFPILYSQIAPGTSSWGTRYFTQNESNEISTALVTDQGVATQDKLWNRDCDEMYIPLLRDQCGITDPKTAVFGLSVHHQAPNAFWQIYNAVGNTDYNTWYTTTLNNGIVGSYTNRQNTVKRLLDEWDGESGKEGFGSKDPTINIGGNQDPNYGNPEDTFKEILTNVVIGKIQKIGKELLLHVSVDDRRLTLPFYKVGNGSLYYPKITKEIIEGETGTTPTPPTPELPGSNEDLNWIVAKIQELEGTLQYSQSAHLRTNIEGGFCDCSGLVWWLYNQRGFNIGTWTGTQIQDGELIKQGSYTACTPDGLQYGDLVLFSWNDGYFQASGHIELYIEGDTIMGHGGDPYYGPTKKSLAQQTSYAYAWQVRRVIKV